MKRIVIFGASVSAQSRNHSTGEITGYSEVLQIEHAHKMGEVEFTRHCYPGNRLSDGGLLKLEEIIASKPFMCLFEPSIEDGSRGVAATDDEYEYVYSRLIEARIIPLTLLLPIPAQRKPELNPVNARVQELCNKFNLPVALVDLSDIGSLDGRFTGVHTTQEGAQIVAGQILRKIKPILSEFSFSEVSADLRASGDIPVHIHRLKPAPWIKRASFSFDLVSTSPGIKRARFVQLQDIGPFSPTLDLRFDYIGKSKRSFHQNVSVWDSYCHYPRRSYVTLFDINLEENDSIMITVSHSDTDPDYANCRRADVSFPPSSQRELRPAGAPHIITQGSLGVTELRPSSGTNSKQF